MNLFFTDMVIGFTQRIRTVSESDAPEGEDIFTIEIPVATLRIAEKEHPMLFLLQESSSTAIVGPRGDLENNPLRMLLLAVELSMVLLYTRCFIYSHYKPLFHH